MTVSFRAEHPIAAPAERAWQVLIDLDSYGEWNRFTPRVSGQLRAGSLLLLWVRIGTVLMPQVERVENITAGQELSWGTRWPLGMLRAMRFQRLHAAADGTCVYETEEAFAGPLAPLVGLLAGGLVQRGFDSIAAGLASRVQEIAA